MSKSVSARLVALVAAGVTTLAMTMAASPGSASAGAAPAPALGKVSASVPAPAGLAPRHTYRPLRVADPAGYARDKAAADAAAASSASAPSGQAGPSTATAPLITHSFMGINNTSSAPSDSTSAVGNTRFIELINSHYAIYSKTSGTPLATGLITVITGCTTNPCVDDVFDPQIIWDPGTKRFFYAADDVVDATHNFLAFGFSTSATPTAASWCRYNLAFGASFPDYPKLGDTKDFALIGTNIFNGNTFGGSDLSWISKPPIGTTCPAASTFKAGTFAALKNANGTAAFTPVPANQTDTSGTGWVVARPLAIPSAGATSLTLIKVTRNATTGNAVIPARGTSVVVPAYKVPASAAQSGSANRLDTLDARNTQAVSGIDPAHGTSVGLWTQHTVFGGAGAEVRWYEINPATHTLFQSGAVSSPTAYSFNGAVSPDREVNGATRQFGSNMALGFNTSSGTTQSNLMVVTKLGAAAQSAPVSVHASTGPDIGFDCVRNGGICRWGDYAGATPDPTAGGIVGAVWFSSMLTFNSSDTTSANWMTWNFAATP